jgi:wyosine [tRNA(Phe)-imidazoG37] synthetase (radical SAM superfamily)
VDSILAEISHALARGTAIDHITFSGSGEPTLHREIGLLIQELRTMTEIPIAVLTNSSLLDRKDVQDDITHASIVAPTLSTTREDTFRKIHRAHCDLRINTIIEGLVHFRTVYSGMIWLEVMLLQGFNDTDHEILELKKVIERIRPDKVHLNTVVRPPLESWAKPVSHHMLQRIQEMIGKPAEIIAETRAVKNGAAHRNIDRRILEVIQRRPLTNADLSAITGIHPAELTKHIARLLKQKKIQRIAHDGKTFYEISHEEDP